MTIKLRNGQWLLNPDGTLAICDENCCAPPCPCVDLSTLPTVCIIDFGIPALSGGWRIYADDTDNLNNRGSWTIAIEDVEGQDICMIYYTNVLRSNKCIGECVDAGMSTVTSEEFPEGFCCESPFTPSCEVCGYPEECNNNIALPEGTQRKCWTGSIKWGDRKIASCPEVTIQIRYNCNTEIWEQKISFKYVYNHYVIGYFDGTLEVAYFVDFAGDENTLECHANFIDVISVWNTGCDDYCYWETEPVAGGHDWPTTPVVCTDAGCSCLVPTTGPFPSPQVVITTCGDGISNRACENFPALPGIDYAVWMGFLVQASGLVYGSVLYPHYEGDWEVVTAPFAGISPTSPVKLANATLANARSEHCCSTEEDRVDVIATTDRKTDFVFDSPDEWTCWNMDPGDPCNEQSGNCGEDVGCGGILGPPGVTTTPPEFCFPNDEAVESYWPGSGGHSIAFIETKLPTETCTPEPV